MNTLDWIAKWADYTPDKIAVTSYDDQESYTYAAIHNYANHVVNHLISINIQEGDRVAVLAEHGPFYLVLFSACQRLGAILTPLNYRLSQAEIKGLIADCSPSLLIYSKAQEAKINFEALNIPFYDVSELTTIFKREEQPAIVIKKEIKERSPLFLFYTSGTTGMPKGVLYTNKMLFWNSLNTSMQLGITFKDSTINSLPPYHTSGWNIFITPLLHKGAHIGMVEKFDAERVLYLLEENKTTLFMALPTMLTMMQKTAIFQKVKLADLRYIISGGEMVSFELVSHWKTEKNIDIRPGYGLTEAGPSITSLHHEMVLLKPNSIGKPNFYLSIKIIDENGKRLKENEIGELCIQGDIITPGYWNNSVATRDKIKDGWLHTGDLVCSDSEGYLYLKGRKDDMYISGGENIYPQEIEFCIEKLTGIKDALVLPIKDQKWGSCSIAFVTCNDALITSEKVHDFLKANLADYKHPKYIFILDKIPLTSLGKVSRKKLYEYFNSLIPKS
ncbi:class I adenylate-forming enzyme family protein [Flavobacterium degerlachei]|jgi:fatty-acyl-CoA synthase|uniref:Fatty-acyl-CoA synthase n=1 Tax=Flavobacterium degerlachei TaxID=229203 RepID=A0A1H2Y8L7_9FLAO|nr:class I adenylate-forming enzyme family protein [Flavobacterium degerlachei]SDX01487.1 fatty-acyl-CoA synthase [Flavobacterium degerlachei]